MGNGLNHLNVQRADKKGHDLEIDYRYNGIEHTKRQMETFVARVKLRNEPVITGDFNIDTCRYLYRVLMESGMSPAYDYARDLIKVSKYDHPDDISDPADAYHMFQLFRLIAKAHNIKN